MLYAEQTHSKIKICAIGPLLNLAVIINIIHNMLLLYKEIKDI